jgi:hypothetical protein
VNCSNFNPLESTGISKQNLFSLNVFLLLGIVKPCGEAVLVTVTEASVVGQIKNQDILKIDNISAVPL